MNIRKYIHKTHNHTRELEGFTEECTSNQIPKSITEGSKVYLGDLITTRLETKYVFQWWKNIFEVCVGAKSRLDVFTIENMGP